LPKATQALLRNAEGVGGMTAPKTVFVSGNFDDARSRQIRFLHEASRLGRVSVLLWPDAAIRAVQGHDPKFPQEERKYLVGAIRYVDEVRLVDGPVDPDRVPGLAGPATWAVDSSSASPAKEEYCRSHGIEYRLIDEGQLTGFPATTPLDASPAAKKVVVTGCYDWFHSGHVAFFEEVSGLGDLYVVVGNDRNVSHLKGAGHPMFSEAERRYVVQSVRYVRQALVSTGMGWMDAEPEILALKPDIYAVNEDGDVPEKREFCRIHRLEYRVLKRVPKAGLPKRESTKLRGF
jgi:cytidyltransferase-like protein